MLSLTFTLYCMACCFAQSFLRIAFHILCKQWYAADAQQQKKSIACTGRKWIEQWRHVECREMTKCVCVREKCAGESYWEFLCIVLACGKMYSFVPFVSFNERSILWDEDKQIVHAMTSMTFLGRPQKKNNNKIQISELTSKLLHWTISHSIWKHVMYLWYLCS